jgi:hypothetical protein
MKEYVLNDEDLISLITEAYNKGYEGYLEMGESVAVALVRRFLKDKKEVKEQSNSSVLLDMPQEWDGQHNYTVTVEVGGPNVQFPAPDISSIQFPDDPTNLAVHNN